MIAKTFSFFPCVVIIISYIRSYGFFLKADLWALHGLHRLKYKLFVFPSPRPWAPGPICFWQPRPQFAYRSPSPQFVFTSPGPQSVFLGPQPSICIYRPWLIRIGINKSQRLRIVLLFLFLESNSFVTVIGCCSLLLFVSQVVVHY